ncbi:MAG: hypothetical protein CO099_12820 [Bdellovibrio sp. CG_4_9_14_3_um_filter_39_7]|nr:MAG: hypothetical protein CO099_12820 [Bdellovibrio sp. CG_4_9_14_3_um_filter_39_7]
MKKKRILADVFIYIALVLVSLIYAAIFDPYNLSLYGYEPHPLLLITVILSSYRGLLFAVLGSLFSSTLYLLLIHSQVDYEVVETIFTWSYFSLPATIFFLSIFVGIIRQTTHDRYKGFVEADKKREIMLNNLEKNQKKIEIENRELKERLVTKEDSIYSLYTISQKMTEIDSSILIDNFFEVLRDHAYVAKSEIFETSSDRITSSKGFFGIEKSLYEKVRDNKLLHKSIETKQMKSLMDIDLQSSEEHPIVLSIPLLVEDKLWGVLAIYEIPFLKYVPTTFKMIEIYGKWLSHSLSKADAFNHLEDHIFLDPEFHVYKHDHYLERLAEEIEQAQSCKTKFSVLKLEILNWNILSIGKRKLHKKIIVESLRKLSKKMDVIALGKSENEIEVLVLGSHDRAEGIMDRTQRHLATYKNETNNIEVSCWDYSGEVLDTDDYAKCFKKFEEV